MTELSKNAQVPQCDKTAVMQSAILHTDLRIGNIINSKLLGTNHLVQGYIIRNKRYHLYTDLQESYSEIEDWQGVDITEKWLEKMGFVRDDYTSYRWFILDRSVVYDLDDNCIRISDSWEFGKRKYVHELQNLIFFLSGFELAVA